MTNPTTHTAPATPTRPGYKKTKLGWIPEEWEDIPFGNHITVKSGQGFKAYEYSKDGVKLLQIENVGYGRVKWTDSTIYLPNQYLNDYPKLHLKSGDIVLALNRPITNGSLKIALLEATDEPSILYQRVGKLIINSSIFNREFLFQLCKLAIKKFVQVNSIGSDQPFISIKELYKYRIPLPPLPEQKAIARILRTWDKAIEQQQQLIATKQQRKKALMQQLLTGKKRLPGFSGEFKRIGAGEVFESVSVKGFEDEELLSATQDRGMIPRTMLEGRVTMPTSGTESFKLVEIGDFVISLRSFQGGLEYSEYRGLVSPAYTVLKPKLPVENAYYRQYFKSYDFIGHLSIAVIGIRDGKQISYSDFCTVKIPYPSPQEQTAIAQVLQAADKEINLLEQQLTAYRQQKKGLMQQLLTGKVRVKNI